MTRAVFIGRFQPFHRGHHHVVEELRDEYDSFTVVVGSPEESRTGENPLTFEERKQIIRDCFPGIRVEPLPDTEDTEEGDREWTENLVEKFDPDAVVSGNDLVQRLVREHSDAEAVEPELHQPGVYSGTEIRRRIRSGEEWRYLVPDCAEDRIETFLEAIEETGADYEFEPGWKRENAYHGTEED